MSEQESKWQTMATAPRDRSRVLLYRRTADNWRARKARNVLIGYWTQTRYGSHYWAIEGNSGGLFASDDDLLGWMPLSALGVPDTGESARSRQ